MSGYSIMNRKISYIIKNKDKISHIDLEVFERNKKHYDSAIRGINALYDKMQYKEKHNDL